MERFKLNAKKETASTPPTLLQKLDAGINRKPVFGSVSLDIENQTVCATETGKSAYLTKSEFQVLWLLIRAQGNIITADEITEFLHEDDPDNQDLPLSNSIDVFVSRIRNKLNSIGGEHMRVVHQRGLGLFVECD